MINGQSDFEMNEKQLVSSFSRNRDLEFTQFFNCENENINTKQTYNAYKII